MAQVVGGLEMRYTLDVAVELPVVLSDGHSLYLWGGAGNPAKSQDSPQTLIAQYRDGAWSYVLHDGPGSVRQVASAEAVVNAAYSFDPFGVPLGGGNGGGDPYGYTGEWWDSQAQLLYLRARYYSPGVGRFVSKDPWLGVATGPQTLNRYAYVTNNPINFSDPSGLQGPPPLPPGYNENWEKNWGTRENATEPHFWDPEGGEWRYQPEDKWHYPHWDYNPWDEWNSSWRNVPINPKDPIYKSPPDLVWPPEEEVSWTQNPNSAFWQLLKRAPIIIVPALLFDPNFYFSPCPRQQIKS